MSTERAPEPIDEDTLECSVAGFDLIEHYLPTPHHADKLHTAHQREIKRLVAEAQLAWLRRRGAM